MGTWFIIEPAVENVSITEMSYLNGVTSNIQTQIDGAGLDTTADVAFTSATPATSTTAAAFTVAGGIGLGGYIKQF